MCDQPEERPLSKVLTTCDDLELTKAVEEIKSNIPWKQYFPKRSRLLAFGHHMDMSESTFSQWLQYDSKNEVPCWYLTFDPSKIQTLVKFLSNENKPNQSCKSIKIWNLRCTAPTAWMISWETLNLLLFQSEIQSLIKSLVNKTKPLHYAKVKQIYISLIIYFSCSTSKNKSKTNIYNSRRGVPLFISLIISCFTYSLMLACHEN
jgi:hypothetical protein